MKGRVTEGDEYNLIAQGDWRTAAGEIVPYDEKRASKVILVSGAKGQYLFYLGNWQGALTAWWDDLQFIERVEREQGIRLHKGWFYYQTARAYAQLHNQAHFEEDLAEYERWLAKAREEDALSYGEKAAVFPAANPVPEATPE